MNYKILELSLKEKVIFRGVMVVLVLFISWLFYDSFVISLPLLFIITPLQNYYKKTLMEKRKGVLLMQFRDLLYSLSSLTSAGRSVGQALEESVDFWKGTYKDDDYIMRELKYMTDRMKKGNETDVAVLRDFAERSDLEDVRDLASVCRTCKESGGNLPKAINRGADLIGDKIALERELKTIMAQKRLEGRIVAASPFVMTFFIRITSPEYLLPLTTTTAGHIITTAALAMIVYSWMIIERMNNIEF